MKQICKRFKVIKKQEYKIFAHISLPVMKIVLAKKARIPMI